MCIYFRSFQIIESKGDNINEKVILGDTVLNLIDTAGLRHTNDKIEEIGVNRSKILIENTELVFAIFDGSKLFDENDQAIIDLLNSKDSGYKIAIINKTDLENKLDLTKIENKFDDIIKISAIKEDSFEIIKKVIEKTFKTKEIDLLTEAFEDVKNSNPEKEIVDSIKFHERGIRITTWI